MLSIPHLLQIEKKYLLEHIILFALRFIHIFFLDISPLQVIKIKKLHLH